LQCKKTTVWMIFPEVVTGDQLVLNHKPGRTREGGSERGVM